jgi:peptidoglycan hydrolase CwlO-like protein
MMYLQGRPWSFSEKRDGDIMKYIYSSVLLLIFTGCGRPQVQTQVSNVTPQALGDFPKQSMRFVNNRWFLWKVNGTPDDVATALQLSQHLDDLDTQALPLNDQYSSLNTELNPLTSSLTQYQNELSFDNQLLTASNTELSTVKQNLQTAQTQLTAAQAASPQNPTTIQNLQVQISGYNGQITELNKTIVKLRPRTIITQSHITTLNNSIAPIQAQLNQIQPQRTAIQNDGQQTVENIMQVVDWFPNQPTSVSLQFDSSGNLQVTISNWQLLNAPSTATFSTSASSGMKPTIANTSYAELGGTYQFDVYNYSDAAQTQLAETYHFNVSRTHYNSPDGRIFLGGEITVTEANGQVRVGVAELIDRNN